VDGWHPQVIRDPGGLGPLSGPGRAKEHKSHRFHVTLPCWGGPSG
jgi:hypothetical protein